MNRRPTLRQQVDSLTYQLRLAKTVLLGRQWGTLRTMDTAPKNGDRILLLYTTQLFISNEYRDMEPKWEECFWDDGYVGVVAGKKSFIKVHGRWTPWCGNRDTKSTLTITKPLAWLPLP